MSEATHHFPSHVVGAALFTWRLTLSFWHFERALTGRSSARAGNVGVRAAIGVVGERKRHKTGAGFGRLAGEGWASRDVSSSVVEGRLLVFVAP